MKRYIPNGAEGEEFFWEDQQYSCSRVWQTLSLSETWVQPNVLLKSIRCHLIIIKLILSQKHDGPTIVMTHHAPSFKSSHPKYDSSYIKGGFCSNLDYVIEEYQPDLSGYTATRTKASITASAQHVIIL
jgi:hypothetical protein